MPTLWKVTCQENKYPGMWHRCYKQQCVGIGWPPNDDWHLHGRSKLGEGWNKAREALKRVAIGDYLIVALKDHRIGRLGVVTGKTIEDHEWNPLVPARRGLTTGQMGRRILVRWDLATGPDSRDEVVALPIGHRLNNGELRPTIGQVRSQSVTGLKSVMNDESNWVGLLTHFDYERALSGYIAAYPHKLEDGFLPHPDMRVREQVFQNKSRSDVLLTDRSGKPVVVECKQDAPKSEYLKQIRNYMRHVQKITGETPRGVLVHGGTRKLSAEISAAASKIPRIEIVQYSLEVGFASCG